MKQRLILLAVFIASGWAAVPGQQQDTFRFRTGVELINVTATVTDRNGRFVSGLRREDFRIFEDEVERGKKRVEEVIGAAGQAIDGVVQAKEKEILAL